MVCLSHSVIEIYYHFCFATKYRRSYEQFKIINWRDIWDEVCYAENFEICTDGAAEDHIHLLIKLYDSRVPVCDIAEQTKSSSSRKLSAILGDNVWQGWQRGYYCASVGKSGRSRDMVAKYLAEQ